MPFDKITDCDILEPAGNECLCIPRILFKVRIDTASSSQDRHELVIAGLKNPHEFKKLVWAMKRAQRENNGNQQQPNALEMMRSMPSLTEGSAGAGGDDITTILKEIRDELRRNNQVMTSMEKSSESAVPTREGPSVDGKLV